MTSTPQRKTGRRAIIGLLILLGVAAAVALGWFIYRQFATPPPSVATDPGWTVDASEVGLAGVGLKCSDLPIYTGDESVPNGMVISEMRVTTPLNLSAGNITIERSCIQPTSVARGLPVLTTTDDATLAPTNETVTIRDNEIDGSLLSQEHAAMSSGFIGIANVQSNYIHHLGSGIYIMNAGTHLDAVIERNYVTDLVAWGDGATNGNHSDAFTIRDFSAERPDRKLTVRNNRFDCDSDNATGALFIQTFSGPIENVVIEGNLLEGLGYQLILEETNSSYNNLRASNNRFTGTGWGPAYVTGGPGWAQWSENYVYTPEVAQAAGAELPQP